jgi:hypothetical protein
MRGQVIVHSIRLVLKEVALIPFPSDFFDSQLQGLNGRNCGGVVGNCPGLYIKFEVPLTKPGGAFMVIAGYVSQGLEGDVMYRNTSSVLIFR